MCGTLLGGLTARVGLHLSKRPQWTNVGRHPGQGISRARCPHSTVGVDPREDQSVGVGAPDSSPGFHRARSDLVVYLRFHSVWASGFIDRSSGYRRAITCADVLLLPAIGVVSCFACQHCPADARVFVGDRHQGFVVADALSQSHDPVLEVRALVGCSRERSI